MTGEKGSRGRRKRHGMTWEKTTSHERRRLGGRPRRKEEKRDRTCRATCLPGPAPHRRGPDQQGKKERHPTHRLPRPILPRPGSDQTKEEETVRKRKNEQACREKPRKRHEEAVTAQTAAP